MNVTEYLEYLDSLGIREKDFPAIQPVHQKRIWDRLGQHPAGPEALESAIHQLRWEDHRFSMEGGSWTNNISWVRRYGYVLGPIDQASALFLEKAGRFRHWGTRLVA